MPPTAAQGRARHRAAGQPGTPGRKAACCSLPPWESGPHSDNLNRALGAVLDWTDPIRVGQEGRGSVWTRVPRELRAGLKAAVLAGKRLPGISPHDLRHTYATLALRHGVPVEVVSKNLGHGSPAIAPHGVPACPG